jgi:hypothetical protein
MPWFHVLFFLHIFICILAIKGSIQVCIFFLQRYPGNENKNILLISCLPLYLGPGMRNVL